MNLINKEKLKNIFLKHKIYVIFHFAAFSNVNESKKSPKKFPFWNQFCTQCVKENALMIEIK